MAPTDSGGEHDGCWSTTSLMELRSCRGCQSAHGIRAVILPWCRKNVSARTNSLANEAQGAMHRELSKLEAVRAYFTLQYVCKELPTRRHLGDGLFCSKSKVRCTITEWRSRDHVEMMTRRIERTICLPAFGEDRD